MSTFRRGASACSIAVRQSPLTGRSDRAGHDSLLATMSVAARPAERAARRPHSPADPITHRGGNPRPGLATSPVADGASTQTRCRAALQGLADLSRTANKMLDISISYSFGMLAAFQTPTDCGPFFSASHEGW